MQPATAISASVTSHLLLPPCLLCGGLLLVNRPMLPLCKTCTCAFYAIQIVFLIIISISSQRGTTHWNQRILNRLKSKSTVTPTLTTNSFVSAGLLNARSICNKTEALTDILVNERIQILIITETWLRGQLEWDNAILNEITPPTHEFFHVPRIKKKGGGIAVIISKKLRSKQIDLKVKPKSFELCLFHIEFHSHVVVVASIYRPPNTTLAMFYDELRELCSSLVCYSHYILLGDFNLSFKPDSALPSLWSDLLETFSLTQHITEATHDSGNILDMVVSNSPEIISEIKMIDGISDHRCILFSLATPTIPVPPPIHGQYRSLKSININEFKYDLQAKLSLRVLAYSPEPIHSNLSETEKLTNFVLNSFTEVLNAHAPLRNKRHTPRCNIPWWSNSIRREKKVVRSCERRWRNTKTDADRIIYKSGKAQYYKSLR